ncbi:MAG TPA: hypothetical protein VMT43_12640 [Acidimicrobiales bacterium]|nr:hypothetical protein [Acidimicrobiales bacterium]
MPSSYGRVNDKIYIHELIDVIGHNRARYMHHMTANWCPVAREERNQLCFGVWGTVGSTGRWPEVVNMWELDGWDGLVANFGHELSHASLQDPSLSQWWAVAAQLRRGGVDRIVVPEPWTDPIDVLVARGVRGEVYAHERYACAPGRSRDVLAQLHDIARPSAESLGLVSVGAFNVAMVNDAECLAIWALPDWDTWAVYEQAWDSGGAMRPWANWLVAAGVTTYRTLMVDAPLAPLRIGRQPEVGDRRPLDEL